MAADLRAYLEARAALPLGFSPDGETVLVSSNLPGTMQLYTVSRGGGELGALTAFAEPVTGEYLPTGNRILLAMDEGGNERVQLSLLDPERPFAAEPLVHDPEFIHRPGGVSRDGRLLAYACNRRNDTDFDVWVRNLESGEERCVLAPGGWCDAVGFSPDGRWLAAVRLTERSGDNDLLLVDLERDEFFVASPHEDEAFLGPPAWLPGEDAFLYGTSEGRDTVGVACYELATRRWRYVLEGEWDLEPTVDPTGTHLLVHANEDGYSRLELRNPRTLAVTDEVPLPGRGVVTATYFSLDGSRLVLGYTSPVVPGDVWLYDLGERRLTRLTESPFEVEPGTLVEPELHRFASFDGESVPVLLHRPSGDAPAPVVVDIHGGPEAQRRPIFAGLAQYLVEHGFAVAMPNVRGSTGYGKRYEHLDDRHLRLDSVRDLVSLHEWLGANGCDPARVVLYGGSYGGYMVLAGLAFHPERWAAGVDVVGISSLVSFLENTAAWRRAFREREYGSLEHDREFLAEVSPLTHVDRIAAPLFIIHGANDPRVPVGEARQISAALGERGIRCELLVYEDEGHGLAKLANRLDAYPRAVAFLEEVLSAAPAQA